METLPRSGVSRAKVMKRGPRFTELQGRTEDFLTVG